MDEFVLGIDYDKFRSTNGMWNRLMLNDPWSVGYVSQLIETQEWQSKEDWENFYFQSGEERSRLLGDNATLLNDFTLQLSNKNKIYSLPWDLKNLNYQKGRTRADLQLKAQSLYNAVKDNGYGLSLEDCFECVRFRTICETWNGIIVRENNTIKNLSVLFPQLSFVKTSGEVDHKYAVDYEVYLDGVLKCALQIKPKTYLGNAPYIRKARMANEHKYAQYFNLKGVRVFNVISKSSGEIINTDIISILRSL